MRMKTFLESQTLLDPSISDGEYSVYIRITNLYSPARELRQRLWKDQVLVQVREITYGLLSG